MLGKILFLF